MVWLRGALEAEALKREPGESMRGGCPPLIGGDFFKIYVSEIAFQAILKPFLPYPITSILSKVGHSNPKGVL